MRFLIITVAFFVCSYSINSYSFQNEIPTPSIQAPLADKSLLLDITQVGQKKLVAVGEYGHILLSKDGKKWRQAEVPVQSTLTSVYFHTTELGWAVGHDATILHSKDGGESWAIQHYAPELEKPLFDIVFNNTKDGIAVGAYGQTFRTSNGGKTWQSEFHQEFLLADDIDYLADLKREDEEAYLDEIAFILPHFNKLVKDGRTLFLLGEIGMLAKSNDFGMTWQKFDDIYQGSFFSLARTKSGNLIVAGLRGHVFRGIKNGSTWSEVNTNTTALLNEIIISNDDRVIILGNNGVLLESNDDGVTYKLHAQKDGKALIAGVLFQEQLIVVSDVGIKHISLK
ncbi:YCF48-related protein [Colwellia sp. RSH04]|uniref:WD40/YVTN/BNR-like repeat-containing protein n=1 Tax=Colwellia sp. RSH04 TaxID=2305464 RepID=UPI000E57ACDD|nr:YCF48-related protein [Colwellia sp. RSH04]RHW77186.1 hypothetical protein D1094_04650 [Colwellia sp. RSH04]